MKLFQQYIIFFLSSFISFSVNAQNKLTVIVDKFPENTDKISIAGNFNGWNPDKNYLEKTKQSFKIELKNIQSGRVEFKFTKGNWNSVETTSSGNDIENRVLKINSDTTIFCSIEGFRNENKKIEKKHTASKNVKLMDTAFYIPQLKTTRTIRLYLPEDYYQSKRKYPVLYMQDGQNLFDEFTSSFGEWKVDETLDSLGEKSKVSMIVVGIDNGPKRLNEYNPVDNEKFGKGEGEEYLDFLVKTLKPFIDEHYRTLPNRNNTIIAGSSMGGLIAYYAMLKEPLVFGKAGIFSPAFWTALPALDSITSSRMQNISGKMFFYMGEKEDDSAIKNMESITDKLGLKNGLQIVSIIDPEGKHNESYWRKWFPIFVNWINDDGLNYVIPSMN